MVAGAVLALVLASGGAGVPSSTFRYGINGTAMSRGDSEWDKYKALGVSMDREDFTRRAESGEYDAFYAGAARRGVEILPLINAREVPATESARARYAAMFASHVERYGPGGAFWRGRPDGHLAPRVFEVMNEPYIHSIARGYDPRAYALTVKKVAEVVRNIDPRIKITVAGELTYQFGDAHGHPWVDALFRAVPNLGDYFEIVAVHPYGHDPEHPYRNEVESRWFFRRIEEIKRRFDAHGAKGKRYWITELGNNTDGADAHTEAEQASYLQGYIDRSKAYGWVDALFVYTHIDSCTDPADKECWFGITRPDGSRKPAWGVLHRNATGGS